MEFKFFEFKFDDVLYIVTLKVDKVKKRLAKKLSLIYPEITILWLELNNHFGIYQL